MKNTSFPHQWGISKKILLYCDIINENHKYLGNWFTLQIGYYRGTSCSRATLTLWWRETNDFSPHLSNTNTEIRDGLPLLSMFFLSMFSVHGHHLFHTSEKSDARVIGKYGTKPGEYAPHYQNRVKTLFPGLSGYVISSMTPRIPHPCRHNR